MSFGDFGATCWKRLIHGLGASVSCSCARTPSPRCDKRRISRCSGVVQVIAYDTSAPIARATDANTAIKTIGSSKFISFLLRRATPRKGSPCLVLDRHDALDDQHAEHLHGEREHDHLDPERVVVELR